MVCTCLQKATLINSTTLTITWMGLELDSTWGHVDLCERLANLNEGHPFFFNLNLAKNSAYTLYRF